MGNSTVVRSILMAVALTALAACSSPRENMLGSGGGGRGGHAGGSGGHGGGMGGTIATGSGGTAVGGMGGSGGIVATGGQSDLGGAGAIGTGGVGTGGMAAGGIGAGGKATGGTDTGGKGTGGVGTGGVGTGGVGGSCAFAGGCCTNSGCPGDCMMCNTTTHTCVAAKGVDDPNGRCAGTCDATGACKSKQGQTCNTAAQCLTSYCADGVCCNTACSGSCEFCNGTTPGTCGFATGAPKTGHPACAGTGTCGGSCDGTKATCKVPGSETSCRSMSCSASTMTNPAVCDGSGNCPAATTTSCNAFACNGTSSCYTSCQTASQCAANSICNVGQCVKCPTGQTVCSNGCYDTNNDANHCGATTCKVCAGSTPSCASGACTCRRQKPSNLLTNGGFNGSASGWTTDGSYNSANDAEGCNGSGSLKTTNATGNASFSECVNGVVANQMYTFGLLFKAAASSSPADGVYCTLTSYGSANCGGSTEGQVATQVSSDGSSWVPGTVDILTGGPSMNISCSNGGLGIGSGAGYVDQVYLGPSSDPGF